MQRMSPFTAVKVGNAACSQIIFDLSWVAQFDQLCVNSDSLNQWQ